MNNGNDINTKLLTVEQVSHAIEEGRVLWLAGNEALLAQLPKGRWIGGSIPYFMADQGGQTSQDRIFANELNPALARKIQIKFYNEHTIRNIAKEAPDDGFSIILIPATSQLHLNYAQHAPDYEEMFLKPIAGWITGVHLDDLGTIAPVVYNGGVGKRSETDAVVMHVTLKPNKVAHIGIVNTLQPGDGDEFEFPETGFSASTCLVNGIEQNLADYIAEHNVDTRFPLIADYSGAMINVSFQDVNEDEKTVTFYAPVFAGVKYKLANTTHDYVENFTAEIPHIKEGVTFSCNCVLNYIHSELEGKKTGDFKGPMTFGEIAYQLLNQTMVYLTVEDV